mgnify:CR=1 FL=1
MTQNIPYEELERQIREDEEFKVLLNNIIFSSVKFIN